MKIPEIYTSIYIFMEEKIRQKFCGPQYNISMKFGPPEKKSGQPWFSASMFITIFPFATF